MRHRSTLTRTIGAMALSALLASTGALASSHMDAPLITLDDPANTTDVYAFVAESEGRKFLSTALAVNPFEEPGIGPNAYRFDDRVRYEIHVALGEDLAVGRPTVTYRFDFRTEFPDRGTILQGFLGTIRDIHDDAQNLRQVYDVTRIDRRVRDKRRRPQTTVIGRNLPVPPNNQGNVTPEYNQGSDGEQRAREGVDSFGALDRYTQQAVQFLEGGHVVFAGQRDDGFYADIQAIFDLLALRSGNDRFDSQGGFNVHTIALNIPVEELGGDLQQVGVYATTSRPTIKVVRRRGKTRAVERFVQVARQGNPLFCEALVAIEDKDLYNRTTPQVDRELFAKYALEPELATLLGAIDRDRTDLAAIFIPDVIKVDLSTGPARLAGGGAAHATNPDDPGFHRLGFFGNDRLTSRIDEGFGGGLIPGGWPNGRRFGDDVLDIAITAVISDLRPVLGRPAGTPIGQPIVSVADGIDNVNENDISYNRVFPYAATPLNGRNHPHH